MQAVSPEPRTKSARWIAEVVAAATGTATEDVAVERRPGHASVRSYWRARHPGGTVMVMFVSPDAPSDEIGKGGPTGPAPFVAVLRYLEGIGVRVPELRAWSQADGFAVLEDLGDDMMVTRLETGAAREPLYRAAISQLAAMRVRAAAAPDPACVAFQRRYDEDLYSWELEHFVEWMPATLGDPGLSPAERRVVDRCFGDLAARLAAEPEGLTHRDYQSRNIMVLPGGALAVIDFQDALLGPRAYDLVSLLRDSYVPLERDFIVQMVRHYLDKTAALGGPELDPAQFAEIFDLVTVQRKLKDAGRFVYLDRVKGNPDFLRFVPAALGYVRDAFGRLPELRALQDVLTRHVPELGPGT